MKLAFVLIPHQMLPKLWSQAQEIQGQVNLALLRCESLVFASPDPLRPVALGSVAWVSFKSFYHV